MAVGKKLSIAFMVSIMLLSVLSLISVDSGGQELAVDRVVVKTDYQMLGFNDLQGGGHLTYELHGKAAGDLRRAVLARYDGLGPTDGVIDSAELKRGAIESPGTSYIADLELALREHGRFFHGITNSYDPLHENQGEDITIDAVGFVEVRANIPTDDYTSVYIYLYFDSSQTTGTFTGNMIANELFDALYQPFLGHISLEEIDYSDYRFEYHHNDYRVSLGSLYNPDTPNGNIHIIRTPAGELSFYNVKNIVYDGSSINPQDRITYSSFNFLENPQILFIVIFICSYLLSSMPTKFYSDYKYAYPRRTRHKAMKIKWLHLLGKVLILLLLLFYFFPTFFGLMGSNAFLGGMAMWILAPVFTVTIIIVSKMLYDKQISDIPRQPTPLPKRRPETRPQPKTVTPAGVNVVVQSEQPRSPVPAPIPVPVVEKKEPTGPPCVVCDDPITDYVDLAKCKCGAIYHESCEVDVINCPKCDMPFVEEAEPEPEMESIQCPTCGEVNKVLTGADMYKIKCIACEVILQGTEPGYNYLVIDDERKTAFEMFVSLLKKGSPGLCISTTFPDKLKREYDLESVDIVWLTDTSTPDQKTMNPHRLEFEMMRTYASFVKNNTNATILLDGFEYMVVENGFEKVFKFIKKLNDLSSVNSGTLFIPIGTSSLETDQLGVLRKEFDKVVETEDEE